MARGLFSGSLKATPRGTGTGRVLRLHAFGRCSDGPGRVWAADILHGDGSFGYLTIRTRADDRLRYLERLRFPHEFEHVGCVHAMT